MFNQEDEPIILQSSNQPEVINRDLLISLVINQGPKGDAAKFFPHDGIKLDKVTQIRIEFLNILRISHLWLMKNLVKLSLSNNIIEKIENLDELTHLKELDLSFNYIKVIENLDHLVNLEVLLLHSNKIAIVQGLDNLQKLEIFSIGNNKISDWNHVLYLRKLKGLRSLNTDRNPCTEEEGYFEYVIAFIPQLVYFWYRMIKEDERHRATDKYQREIVTLQEDEANEENKLVAKAALQNRINLLTVSFMENLDEDNLFTEMFADDKEGSLFATLNEDAQMAHDNYKSTFCKICHELCEHGLEEHKKRSNDIALFKEVVEKGKDNVQNEVKIIMDELVEKKTNIFKELSKVLKIVVNESDEDIFEEKVDQVQRLSDEFNELISNAWEQLLHNEITFHRQVEDIIETFKINMTDMLDTFLETSRNYFAQMRNEELEYNKIISNITLEQISDFVDDKKVPLHIIEFCDNKETLNNSFTVTHNKHLKIIDAREDRLLKRMNDWFHSLTEQLTAEEIERHRRRILEISHFLEYLHEEFKHLQHHYNIEDSDAINIAALFEIDT